MFNFKKLVRKYLLEAADKLEEDACELSDTEAMDILSVIAHEPLSKDQACSHLNMSRSKFDAKLLRNELPKGRKRRGHKELDWYKDELELYRLKKKKVK